MLLLRGQSEMQSQRGQRGTKHRRWFNDPCLTLLHDGSKQFVFSRCVEADEVHAPVPAEVPPVEPVPVLELVPGLAPGQEVVVTTPFDVGNS